MVATPVYMKVQPSNLVTQQIEDINKDIYEVFVREFDFVVGGQDYIIKWLGDIAFVSKSDSDLITRLGYGVEIPVEWVK